LKIAALFPRPAFLFAPFLFGGTVMIFPAVAACVMFSNVAAPTMGTFIGDMAAGTMTAGSMAAAILVKLRVDVPAFAFVLGKKFSRRGFGRNFPAYIALYPWQRVNILFAGKSYGLAGFSGSGGTAYAVNVIFRFIREIVIHHHCEVFDVQSPCRNVGSNKQVKFPRLYIFNYL
jgi:hypothetical protein